MRLRTDCCLRMCPEEIRMGTSGKGWSNSYGDTENDWIILKQRRKSVNPLPHVWIKIIGWSPTETRQITRSPPFNLTHSTPEYRCDPLK